MRILLQSAFFAPELISVGKYNTEMVAWLTARGHEVRVVTTAPHYPAWRVMEGYSAKWWSRDVQAGAQVWRCPAWIPAQPSGLRRVIYMASLTVSSLPVMLMQAFWRPDVVIGVEPPLLAFMPARLCAWLSRARSWLHVQDLEVDAAFDLGILKGERAKRLALALERGLMLGCDRVSTISGRMADRLLAKGVSPHQLVHFPNWVSLAPMQASTATAYRRELGIAPEHHVALYAGNMGAKQGLETVVEAAKLLRGRSDVHIMMVGEGPARAALQAAAQGLTQVHFLPLQPSERLAELLATADMHLLPQRAAAADLVMPSKLGGMLSSGRPTIACAHAGTELATVVQGRGLVIAPEDAGAMAQAIEQLAGDKARAAELGAAARHYAVTELDKEAVMRRFEMELQRMLVEPALAR